MPSLDMYNKLLHNAKSSGQAHKIQSDMVMEGTWYNDIASKTGYLYDQEHDDEFDLVDDLHPYNSLTKIPVELKHYEIEYNSLAKDEVSHHIMFKPSYVPNVPYYDEKFAKPLGALYPIGLFCDLPDESGIYRRWIVVGEYRAYSNQFISYLVLPCNHKLQWIHKGQKYESWVVLRSQNSYNAGVWIDYKVQSPENQKIVWCEFNDKTKTIFYDQRIAISQLREEPVVWSCSKVEDKGVDGIAKYTFKQDKWNAYTDYIEYNDDGNLVGMWCNYFDQEVIPEPPEDDSANITCKITYDGVQNSQFKVKGSARTFSVTFYKDEEIIPYRDGVWSFIMDDSPADDLFTLDMQDDHSVKVKFIGTDKYMGKKVTITFKTPDNIASSIQMNIVGK